MAGGGRGQGRGGQRDRTPNQQQKQSSSRGGRTPHGTPHQHTPKSSEGRGRGRHGGCPGRGANATPLGAQHTPNSGRSPWSAGPGAGGPGPGYVNRHAAANGVGGYSRGSAAVAPEDHTLLLVGKDAKMPRVWELRVHPSQRFSSAWLAAVDRWAENMISNMGQQQPPPPPPIAGAASSSASAAQMPPIPAEPRAMDNSDYDDSDLDAEDAGNGVHARSRLHDDLAGAAGQRAGAAAQGDTSSSADSEASDEDTYDMLSYLRKLSLDESTTSAADAAEPDLDAVSCAATAGSSVAAGRRSRGRRRSPRAATAAAGAGGAGVERGLAARGLEHSESDSSGSWETDSEAVGSEEEQQQQEAEQAAVDQAAGQQRADERGGLLAPPAAAAVEQQDPQGARQQHEEAADADDAGSSASSAGDYEHYAGSDDDPVSEGSEDSEYDAALTAAEEQDLLCEPGSKLTLQQQPRQHPASPSAGADSSAAAAAPAAGSGREKRVRRGERKRQKWDQQLLVSLRLEKQGLTDREAQQLANWFTSSPSARHLSLSKLWLFDNSLGDKAAAALAPLIGPHLAELHLSHNQIGVEGAKALLAAVPLQRAKGVKPLWFRIEWNQVDENELRRFIQQECTSRGLVVDIAQEVPVTERATRTDSKGRELNLSWSRPWQEVHVQMPWLSCQRAAPAEAAVLKAAKAVWSRGAPAAAAAAVGASSSRTSRRDRAAETSSAVTVTPQQQQREQLSMPMSSGSRHGGVIAAAAAVNGDQASLPFMQTPPPPPRPAAAPAGSITPAAPAAARSASAPAAPAVTYQDGPLMLFLDTSAFLSMLGCGGSVTSNTCFTMKLLQALAGSGRFGRGLPADQQTFIVLADTVLKQLDSFKSAEGGVGGPVRRFLDKGLDEVGPKGSDFLTVLAAHEGEGLIVDRQAAVAGSRSPLFNGTTGQRSDLSIIEVGLFFRKELLAAAAAAAAEAGDVLGGDEQAGRDAQPVILVTNDNAQLQLAKSHGLPAFKLAGASEFEAEISNVIKSGGDLSSSMLRSSMAPSATAGLGAVAGRSLQDDFDGSVSCLRGLLEAYQDLSGLLGRVNMLVSGSFPGEEGPILNQVQQLLQDHQHMQLYENSSSTGLAFTDESGVMSVLEASLANISAMERSLLSWEDRAAKHHSPSRVLKWTGSVGRAGR